MNKLSRPNVFIIESLTFDDEKCNRFEGKFLSQILHLGGKKTKYYYIRTKKEFDSILDIFDKSDYRYLHISCHGNDSVLSTTLDRLTFSEVGKMIRPHLKEKRLFISGCRAVNDNLAKEVIPNSECYSLIGPTGDIHFHDAAIIWASFYHMIFKENPKAMARKDILPILQKIADAFGIKLNYFSTNSGGNVQYKKIEIKPRWR